MFRRQKQNPNQPRSRTANPQSRNSAVFSYHANRSIREGSANIGRLSPDDEATPKRKKHIAWLRRLPLFAALGVILICCIVALSLNNNVKVVSVTSGATGLFLRDTRVYQEAAQKLFASSILNRNKLTVDASGITTALKTEFPELQNVSITLPIVGHRPLVYIQPSNPTLFLTTQGGGVYILDKSGRALVSGNEATSHANELRIPTVQDQSGLRVEVGQVVLPSSDVAFIAQVDGQLQAKGLQVESLQLPAASSELIVKLRNTNYIVKFNMQGDAREQAGTFISTKRYLEGQRTTPSQYIDVRVPERVYFK